MKKLVHVTILLLFSIAVSFSCSSLSESNRYNEKKSKRMKKIHFIPKEFNNIKLGYHEKKENNCSPKFATVIKPINTITINTPTKIICDIENGDFTPIIPVCVADMISERRALKYNKLSAMILHIRKLDQETIYSGEIIDRNRYGRPIQAPGHREREKERMARVEEAQKYNDDELNEGEAGGGYENVNLMEYIDMPFKPGKYEIYLSFSGLESNHTIVEIVAK